jgi:hypothetical protein
MPMSAAKLPHALLHVIGESGSPSISANSRISESAAVTATVLGAELLISTDDHNSAIPDFDRK